MPKGANIKKIRVCLIVRHAQIAGTERHVLLLATHLNTDFIEPHVLILEEGELGKILRDRGIDMTIKPNRKSVFHYLQLIMFFARKKFDIVHCHSGGYACLAAKLAGAKRIIYTKHGIGATMDELKHRPLGRRLRDVLINLCVVQYIALTRYDKYIMNCVLHIDKAIIKVISNGIEPIIANPDATSKAEYPTIGFVGRLAEQKGISYLIESIPSIVDKFKKLQVIIAGDGEEMEALKQLVKKTGISQRIKFLGNVKDPLNVINQMDIFVLPSVWEGFPYVLLEAMLLKKPIVASNIFGINEIIDNGVDGILVEPRRPELIADAISDLLSHSEKAKGIGDAAFKKLNIKYTLKKTVDEIEKLYTSLIH